MQLSLTFLDAPRLWAVLGLLRLPLAAFFLWLAFRSLRGDAQMAADFARWGYSQGFLCTIGVAQACGGLALLAPQTSFAGSLLLGGVLLGALYTHARFDPLSSLVSPVVFLIALGLVAVAHRPQLPA
jgi:hypothetical protein